MLLSMSSLDFINVKKKFLIDAILIYLLVTGFYLSQAEGKMYGDFFNALVLIFYIK